MRCAIGFGGIERLVGLFGHDAAVYVTQYLSFEIS
jgi:hypothetical protein